MGHSYFMANCRQSVQTIPLCETAIFACSMAHKHGKIGGDLHFISRPSLQINQKYCQPGLIKGHIGYFKTILDSFQDPCLSYHKFNIFDSIWCISCQNKCQKLNFKFLNLLWPSWSIVAAYEQIWQSVKNTKNMITSTIETAAC